MLVKLTEGLNFTNILYEQLFHMKVICVAFPYLHFGFTIFEESILSKKKLFQHKSILRSFSVVSVLLFLAEGFKQKGISLNVFFLKFTKGDGPRIDNGSTEMSDGEFVAGCVSDERRRPDDFFEVRYFYIVLPSALVLVFDNQFPGGLSLLISRQFKLLYELNFKSIFKICVDKYFRGF